MVTKKSKYKQISQTLPIMEALASFDDILDVLSESEEWRDGLYGTNLENSNRFDMLESAISFLEEGTVNLSDDIDELVLPLPEKAEKEDEED